MGKPWTPTDHNGQPARLYEDGAIRNSKGHMLARLPGATEGLRDKVVKVTGKAFDTLDGPNIGELLGTLKAAKATSQEQAAQAGMIRAARRHSKVEGSDEAWGIVVQAQTEDAISGGRSATGAARFVGEATGKLRKEAATSGPQVAIQVIIGPELRDRYAGSESSGVVVVDEDAGGGT